MAIDHKQVTAVPWHGWQSVSASYGAQIGSERQRCSEMDELRHECESEMNGRIDINVTGTWLIKVVAEFWLPSGRRKHAETRWFFRESTAWDWAEGIATRWEKQYGSTQTQ